MTSRAAPALMLAPALVVVGVLVAAVGALVDDSLRTLNRDTFTLGENWSLANYSRALGSPAYAAIALRTAIGATATTVVAALLGAPYAYLLVRTSSAAWRKALLFILFTPFFIGQVVRGYSWLVLLGRNGVLNRALGAFGIPPQPLLFHLPAVVVGLAQYLLPTAVLMMAPAFAAAEQVYEDASATLGAPPWRTVLHVLLPMAAPGIIAAGAVVFAIAATDFAMPALLGAGRADFSANAIYAAWFEMTEPGLAAAMAVLLALAATLVLGLLLAAARALTPAPRAN
jgi:putative spermidine/putrescine transport system permease protein